MRDTKTGWRTTSNIAHIHAANKGGQRYVQSMTDKERDDFPNLVLLCVPHHQDVDTADGADLYPASLMKTWKSNHEGETIASGEGLKNLTENRLSELLTQAQDKALQALHSTSAIDPTSLELIQSLVSFQPPEEEVVYALERAAKTLAGLEGDAQAYREAAQTLSGLEGDARSYSDAAQLLGNLEGDAKSYSEAAQLLSNLEGQERAFTDAGRSLETIVSTVESRISVLTSDLAKASARAAVMTGSASTRSGNWKPLHYLVTGALLSYILPSVLVLILWVAFWKK